MGIFDKKQNQQNYINLVRKTADDAMPQLTGWDMTLATFESSRQVKAKRLGKDILKHIGAKLAGRNFYYGDNPFLETMFITCFKDHEIYFLSIGDGISKSNLTVDPQNIQQFTTAEIQNITTGMGKKVTIHLRDGGTFKFKYGVGAGSIYSIPEGDKQLEKFLNAFA